MDEWYGRERGSDKNGSQTQLGKRGFLSIFDAPQFTRLPQLLEFETIRVLWVVL